MILKNEKVLALRYTYLVALVISIVFSQIASGFYLAYMPVDSQAFRYLSTLMIFWLCAEWYVADAKYYKRETLFDVGFLLFVFWYLMIPAHLYRTRGLKISLSIVVLFIVLYFGTFVLSYEIFNTFHIV